jgi:RecJ-like exonuclease
MINRCLKCHSPIFGGSCLCGKNAIRCPDCGGDGIRKEIELLEDSWGYMGYMAQSKIGSCPICGGVGQVSVVYRRINGG